MARRLLAITKSHLFPSSPTSTSTSTSPSPSPSPSPSLTSISSILPLLPCKRRKKLLKKLQSPRLSPIQRDSSRRLPFLDAILDRDAAFRFLSRTRSFLSRLPSPRLLPLPHAGKLHHDLGFPRGRKLANSVSRHPLLLHLPRVGYTPHLAFTPLMESLLEEERSLFDSLEPLRVTSIRKLLMISANHRIPLAKLHHCRQILGLPDDFRDRVVKYPEFFRVAVDPDDRHVLELVKWDPALAISALERDFLVDENRVRRTFKFAIEHKKALPLEEDDERRLDELTTFPLISPYSDGSGLKPWSVEAEKYRVGLVHEFLSLTLEKRAWIHHIVEFKEEFNLTKHTYQMLSKQPRAFYLAGTEMNWAVFLKDAYREDGTLIEKDPQVLFNEKLQQYACMTEMEKDTTIVGKDAMS